MRKDIHIGVSVGKPQTVWGKLLAKMIDLLLDAAIFHWCWATFIVRACHVPALTYAQVLAGILLLNWLAFYVGRFRRK